jgi:Nif11 domain
MTMCRDNVVLFAKAAADKIALRQRLAATDSANEWIAIAHDAGFEFTVDDFTSILSDFLGCPVTADAVVREFRAAQRAMGERPLARAMSKRFIGGVMRTCDFWVAGHPQDIQTPAREDDR